MLRWVFIPLDQRLLKACSRAAQGLLKGCSRAAQGLARVFRVVQELSLVCVCVCVCVVVSHLYFLDASLVTPLQVVDLTQASVALVKVL